MTNRLPTHPAYFTRNVPVGPIPAPILLTEEIRADRLSYGDVVILHDQIMVVVEIRKDGHPSNHKGLKTIVLDDQSDGLFTTYGLFASEIAVRVVAVTFGTLDQGINVADLRDDAWTSHGKYDDQASEYVHGLAMDSYDFCGSCDEIGWTATLVTGLRRDATLWQYAPIMDGATADEGSYPVDSWLAAQGMPSAAVVEIDDRGFVYVGYYGTEDEARSVYARLQEDVDNLYRGNDGDEEDETEDEENPYAVPGGLLDEVRYAESFLTDEEK